jgi:hypothetical protein
MFKVVKTEPPPEGADILPFIAKAMEEGRDPIADPTREGGIFVPEDIVAIAADMELVVQTTYDGFYSEFHVALLTEINRAKENGDDPIEEVRLWLQSCLEDDTSLSA